MRFPKKILLDFKMERQLEYAWCWAAVGTSTALYYQPKSDWTQCKIVERTFKLDSLTCCKNPSSMACDRPFALKNEFNEGSFVTAGIQSKFISRAFTVKELMTDLVKKNLVAYRLEIGLNDPLQVSLNKSISNFFHFVVIAGYKIQSKPITTKTLLVYVFDPFSLENGYSVMTYHTFLNNYKSHGGSIQSPSNLQVDKMTYCKITHSFHSSI